MARGRSVNGSGMQPRRREDGILLQALNPEYESFFYSNRQIVELPVRIIGVVVEMRRKIGKP